MPISTENSEAFTIRCRMLDNAMKKSSVSIGLVNPKSPHNVSSIMRTAGNFSVDNVYYTGKRYPRALMRNPDLPDMHRKVGQSIPLIEVDSILDALERGTKVVCIEFVENAISLPDFQHPQNALYLFGPEDGSMTQDIVNQADDAVYIPTIKSMNLAATVNVVLYDRLAKLFSVKDDNEMIRKNRDINNSLYKK